MTEATRDFYDRISHVYDLIADGGEHRARERGLELLGAEPGEHILEIGFGTGQSVVELARSVGDAGRIQGIDISTGMQDVATRRLTKEQLEDRVELRVGTAPPLPYDTGVFDAVTMSFTLELFEEPDIVSLLAECRRVLRPDGRLGVVSMASVPEGQHESWMERTYIWMHQHFPHIVDCRPIPLETLIQAHGFELSTQERLDLFSMPVAVVVATPRDGAA